jgi:hypothetical protein
MKKRIFFLLLFSIIFLTVPNISFANEWDIPTSWVVFLGIFFLVSLGIVVAPLLAISLAYFFSQQRKNENLKRFETTVIVINIACLLLVFYIIPDIAHRLPWVSLPGAFVIGAIIYLLVMIIFYRILVKYAIHQ